MSTSHVDTDSIYLNLILPLINEGLPADAPPFGTAEAVASCEAMSAREELYYSDGMIYKV